MRTAVELAIDTGRRPEEICELDFDCLTRDDDGQPVLIYDNHKANRPARRLPISEQTAAVIIAQQQRVRARYPHTPVGELKLLPTDRRNPGGRRAITGFSLAFAHRTWVDRMPVLRTGDGVEYDKSKVVLYAYRHSYAQRHADAGVPVEVLRELMSHRKLETTSGYYRVGETRRREAVDRVTAMQFDRHGNRIWRQAQALLDSEHARRAVGEVAVPFGVCAEPSNVKAGGGACPFRFRCAGCDHFRTDVSYLPDLHAYLDDLLRTRERLLATTDLDDWARAEAMPSDEEIRRIRRLIDQISDGLDETRTRTATTTSTSRHRRAPPPQRHARHAPHPPSPARPTPGENPMTTNTTAVDAMIDGRRADSTRRRQRVLSALDNAIKDGAELSVTNIARRAGVDRTFLYRHRDLLERIHAAETQPPDKPEIGPRSPAPHCKPTCSPPSNAAPAWPHAPNNSRNACPNYSANKPGAQPDSVPPPTSTNFSNASSRSNNKSSNCGCNSKNATRTSPPPAPPTANSWPAQRIPANRMTHPPKTLAQHLLRTIPFNKQPRDLHKRGRSAAAPGRTPREPPPLGPRYDQPGRIRKPIHSDGTSRLTLCPPNGVPRRTWPAICTASSETSICGTIHWMSLSEGSCRGWSLR